MAETPDPWAPVGGDPWAPPDANPWAAPADPGFTPLPPPPPSSPGYGPGPAFDDGHPRRRPPSARLVAALLATALVSGGAGAGIALALDHGAAAPSATALPTATPGRSAINGASSLDIRAIASRVDAATVDIDATGADGAGDEGTGMVLTASGIVLTNNHVVVGSTELSAQVDGQGKSYPATVIGVDVTQDVALLQLHGGGRFRSVTIGDSGTVEVGDQVVAVGNALALPGPETVTSGLISAVHRAVAIIDPTTGSTEDLSGMFQTSAAISSGNSGGPLVDAAGRVIAMNTAAASTDASGATATDVGFAIPINRAMSLARQILSGRSSSTVQIGAQALTGVSVTSVACADGEDGCLPLGFGSFGQSFFQPGFYQAPTNEGAVVDGVGAGTPAAAAGVQVGDVITSFDKKSVTSPQQLTALLNGLKVGTEVTVGWVDDSRAYHSARFPLVQGPNL